MSVCSDIKFGHGRQRALIILIIIIIIYGCYCLVWVTVPPTVNPIHGLGSSTSPGFLPLHEAESLCSSNNLTTYPHRISRRKIYDLVLVDNELDWLEIRMNELRHRVDYFVILEATSTFTRNPKPLNFKSNFDRFQDFYSQIIYRVLSLDHIKTEDAADREDGDAWDREIYSRNSLFDAVFPSLIGPEAPELGDVILVSDADEIPRTSTLTTLRNCQFPERTTLRSQFFRYSFQWQHTGQEGNPPQEWDHPQATYYQGPNKTIKPHDLRMNNNGVAWDLRNAGWHCSWCFATVAEMIHKMESWSHTYGNQPQFKDPTEIVRRIRQGIDIFDGSKNNRRVDSRKDIPEYLKENQRKFDYMLDRDPVNANFRDYVGEGG